MKIRNYYIGLLALIVSAGACKKDNFKAPTSLLKGQIQYQGEAIQVEYDKVPFELYQYGFGKVGPIGQTFAPDGTFSSLLFDGQYKFIVPNNQGPFLWPKTAAGNPDSLTINLSGSQTLNIDVTPYYMIRTPKFAKSGSDVNATFKIQKIITDANAKDVESVALYVSKTMFVSPADNLVSKSIAGSAITDMNNVALSVTVPAMVPTQNYVFARVGLKIAQVEDRIFSPVVKLTF